VLGLIAVVGVAYLVVAKPQGAISGSAPDDRGVA
jgi:hypothetical protein